MVLSNTNSKNQQYGTKTSTNATTITTIDEDMNVNIGLSG